VVDALGGFFVVVGLGPENVGDEGLRIAIVKGEPAGLNLDHYFVARQENVICGGQREAVDERCVARDLLALFLS